MSYNVILPAKGVPIKAWTRGVPMEEGGGEAVGRGRDRAARQRSAFCVVILSDAKDPAGGCCVDMVWGCSHDGAGASGERLETPACCRRSWGPSLRSG